jgi:hypothetical protein
MAEASLRGPTLNNIAVLEVQPYGGIRRQFAINQWLRNRKNPASR